MNVISRVPILAMCVSLSIAQVSNAIVDTNSNGLSDIWEIGFYGELLPGTFDSQADPDDDGWTNAKEDPSRKTV